MTQFFRRLSPESRRHRFFSAGFPNRAFFESVCAAYTLVLDKEARIVAVASYFPIDATSAEVAFAVEESSRGQGLGSLLLRQLAIAARRNGFTQLKAVTYADNTPMRNVFRESGLKMKERQIDETVEVDLALED